MRGGERGPIFDKAVDMVPAGALLTLHCYILIKYNEIQR